MSPTIKLVILGGAMVVMIVAQIKYAITRGRPDLRRAVAATAAVLFIAAGAYPIPMAAQVALGVLGFTAAMISWFMSSERAPKQARRNT